MPFEIIVAIGVLAGFTGAAAWAYFAVRGIRRALSGKARGPAPTALLQISVVAFVVVALRGSPLLAMFAAALPPLAIVAAPDPWAFSAIMGRAALFAIPAATLALAICLRQPTLRRYAIVIPFAAGLVTALIAGERIGRSAFCQRAEALGLSQVQRNSLLWSLANTPADFQHEIHGLARAGEGRFGWSYSEMDWYPLPETVWINVSSGRPACS